MVMFSGTFVTALAIIAVLAAVWAAVRSYLLARHYSHRVVVHFDGGANIQMDGFMGLPDEIDRLRREFNKLIPISGKADVEVDDSRSGPISTEGPVPQAADNIVATILSMSNLPLSGSNRDLKTSSTRH